MKKAKAKPKTAARKRKPLKAPRRKRDSLQAGLESEFSHAVDSAKSYIEEPERLRQLVQEAATKAASLPREQFKETWAYLQAMLRLSRAYYRGEYRAIPLTTLLLIVAALIYLINPLDLIPDLIPGLGLLDDAFILALTLRQTRHALDDFMTWENAHS